MEDLRSLISTLRSKSKQASLLWLEGLREAFCLHRVVIYCLRSRDLAIRTGQCFLLNGFIFLGRYNDIAKYGFFAIAKDAHAGAERTNSADKPNDLEGIMFVIAEQFYSVLLLSFFFLQVYVTGFIPYIGKEISFLLFSWMYAYYCFEYKWNLSGLSLDKRLDFFESNWAFFGGFGCPCIVAIFLFSPLVSYGVMAILYPLFVLTATGSEADKIIALPRRKWKGFGLGRLPIFVVADYLSLCVLSIFPVRSHQKTPE